MGIKSLLPFIRARNKDVYQTFDLRLLKGCRVALDIPILCYQKKSEAVRKTAKRLDLAKEDVDQAYCTMYMMKRILHTIDAFLVAGVIPVGVFDGKAPQLKDGTKVERAAKSNKKKRNVQELKRILRGLLGLDKVASIVPGEEARPYELTASDLVFLKSFGKPITDIKDIRSLLLNEVNQCVGVSAADYLALSSIFTALGIPWLQAESEAEQTCAQMCRHRDVAAIFTTDSDCLVYGCPIMINQINYSPGARVKVSPMVQGYVFSNVLQVMELTNQQFMDFCIMMGTDFNKNVPDYGPAKNYDLLKHYGSISNIEKARQKLHERGMARRDYLDRGNMGLEGLTRIEKLCYDYDTSKLNYDAVRCFFTNPVKYDKNALKVRVTDNQFEASFNALTTMIGANNVSSITETGKSICTRLYLVSKSVVPLREN